MQASIFIQRCYFLPVQRESKARFSGCRFTRVSQLGGPQSWFYNWNQLKLPLVLFLVCYKRSISSLIASLTIFMDMAPDKLQLGHVWKLSTWNCICILMKVTPSAFLGERRDKIFWHNLPKLKHTSVISEQNWCQSHLLCSRYVYRSIEWRNGPVRKRSGFCARINVSAEWALFRSVSQFSYRPWLVWSDLK